jgi:hypothetical protein
MLPLNILAHPNSSTDIISRCIPSAGALDPEFGLFNWTMCTQPDDSVLNEGFRSFPSGHSSSASFFSPALPCCARHTETTSLQCPLRVLASWRSTSPASCICSMNEDTPEKLGCPSSRSLVQLWSPSQGLWIIDVRRHAFFWLGLALLPPHPENMPRASASPHSPPHSLPMCIGSSI